MLDSDLSFMTFSSSSSSESSLPFAFLFSLSRWTTPSLRPRLPSANIKAITKVHAPGAPCCGAHVRVQRSQPE